jgi:hypothetical protein
MVGIRTDSGERLRREWKILAIQVHYHHAGTFYMPLTKFPGRIRSDALLVFRAAPSGRFRFQWLFQVALTNESRRSGRPFTHFA